MGAIKAWSYSRWATYEECPFKAKLKFVDKLPEPGSDAMDRGTAIHKDIEDFLVGDKNEFSTPLKSVARKYYTELRAKEVYVENEIAFTSSWRRTGWFDRDAWCRVKMDAFVPAPEDGEDTVIVDTKTGGVDKRTGQLQDPNKYDLQMQIYGLAGLILTPWAGGAIAELVFVDADTIVRPPAPYKRSDEESLKKGWENRVKAMLTDTTFEPKPGNACRWCFFRKSNNGPCEF